MAQQCPLCSADLFEPVRAVPLQDASLITCQRCGRYQLDDFFAGTLPARFAADPTEVPRISYAVRQLQRAGTNPVIDKQAYEQLLSGTPLPDPNRLRANLMLYLADKCPIPGTVVDLSFAEHGSIIGAANVASLTWLLKSLASAGHLEVTVMGGGGSAVVTYDGWHFVSELRKGAFAARKGFMAMRYGDAAVETAFTCFKTASVACGFELTRLDENPPAGLIDNRLRVEILTSRFLVVDLTRGNAGAYWEAGFAEGLGKPVIYTCERAHFKTHGTHFDTNHHQTVLWDAADLAAAEASLKATIRATLPGEAILKG